MSKDFFKANSEKFVTSNFIERNKNASLGWAYDISEIIKSILSGKQQVKNNINGTIINDRGSSKPDIKSSIINIQRPTTGVKLATKRKDLSSPNWIYGSFFEAPPILSKDTYYFPLDFNLKGYSFLANNINFENINNIEDLKEISFKNKKRLICCSSFYDNSINSNYFNEKFSKQNVVNCFKGLNSFECENISISENEKFVNNKKIVKKTNIAHSPFTYLFFNNINNKKPGYIRISLEKAQENKIYAISFYYRKTSSFEGQEYLNLQIGKKIDENSPNISYNEKLLLENDWQYFHTTVKLTPVPDTKNEILMILGSKTINDFILPEIELAGILIEEAFESSTYNPLFDKKEKREFLNRSNPILFDFPILSDEWLISYKKKHLVAKGYEKSNLKTESYKPALERYLKLDSLGPFKWGTFLDNYVYMSYLPNSSTEDFNFSNIKYVEEASVKSSTDFWEEIIITPELEGSNYFIVVTGKNLETKEETFKIKFPYNFKSSLQLNTKINKKLEDVTFNLQLGGCFNQEENYFISFNGTYKDLFFFKDKKEYYKILHSYFGVTNGTLNDSTESEIILKANNFEEE